MLWPCKPRPRTVTISAMSRRDRLQRDTGPKPDPSLHLTMDDLMTMTDIEEYNASKRACLSLEEIEAGKQAARARFHAWRLEKTVNLLAQLCTDWPRMAEAEQEIILPIIIDQVRCYDFNPEQAALLRARLLHDQAILLHAHLSITDGVRAHLIGTSDVFPVEGLHVRPRHRNNIWSASVTSGA